MAEEVLNRYSVDQTIQIFKNDQEFYQVIIEDHNINLTDEKYKNLSEVLLTEKEHILDYTIEELNAENPPFLREEIAIVYGKTYIEEAVYRQTIYTFKYSTIKIFFRTNQHKFIPEYDFVNIESEEKMKIFQEAFMREYDRLAKIIDEIYNIVDIDKVPTEYLNYLAQAIGYEREDSKLLTDASFRELIKNIIEIYRIKGTNYSFELFFNFLGYEAVLKEYWFDKRLADPNINSNPETGQTDKKYASFYMTSTKPTKYIPEGMRNPYIVTENLIIETQDVNDFTRMTIGSEYTYEQLLGDAQGYPGQEYSFFKTNVLQYSLSKIITGETEEELSAEDLIIIQRYADFLTPLFIQKNIIILISPFEDYGEAFLLSDKDKHDPRSSNPDDYLDEKMFHLYQGKQPSRYYWDDGNRYYGEDNIPRPNGEKRYVYPTYEYWTNDGFPGGSDIQYTKRTDVEPGGHFISGYHKDTYEKIFDRTVGCGSAYDQISNANLTWDSETILQYISSLLSLNKFFSLSEVTEIICNADIAGSLNNTYFFINGPVLEYYVWYDVNVSGTDPEISGKYGIKVSISTGALAIDVATATTLAIDAKKTYYSPISIPDRAGNIINGSNVVTINTTTADLSVNMIISGSGIQVDTTIISIDSITKITISKNATANGTILLSFMGSIIQISDDFDAYQDDATITVVTVIKKDAVDANDFNTGFTITKITDGADFSPYGNIKERDLIPPMIDGVFIPAEQTFIYLDDFEIGTPLKMSYNFSFRRGDKKRLSEALKRNAFGDDNIRAKIISINVDNGSGKAVVLIYDKNRRFQYLSNNDFISLFDLIDESNEGNYQVESVTRIGDNTEIILTTTFTGENQNREGGFIQLYYEEWLMKNFRFPFMFDRLLEFDSRSYTPEDEPEALQWFQIHPDEHLFPIEADKKIGEPYPFNIPGQNYTNFPEGNERPLDPELLWPWIDNYLAMEVDYGLEINASQMYQLWTFYKIAEQELKVRGLYIVGSAMRSSYKFMAEKRYFYNDYLDMEKI